jgi:predicted transcriptional regulator
MGASMARTSWFDEKAEHQGIQERAQKLESFTSALADGVISKQELEGQEKRLLAAMKTLEPDLSDDQHAKVTAVLVELSAYNIMRLLHELHAERARMTFGKA